MIINLSLNEVGLILFVASMLLAAASSILFLVSRRSVSESEMLDHVRYHLELTNSRSFEK